MPSVEHDRLVSAPFSRVWSFVRDMDNWAPLVTGYQQHQKISDNESIWQLKGELGGLSRVAEFKAVVTEWDESGRVTFTLQGINEPVTGNGTFLAQSLTGTAAFAPERQGVLSKLFAGIFRYIFAQIFGSRSSQPTAFAGPTTAPETRITFQLSLSAGGMAGPVLNMLITPMLKPVAEDLANGIAHQIESGK